MCGIAGFWQVASVSEAELVELARRVTGTLAHRGPDDEGVWVDPSCGLALGHRRLSILDLSPAGHQPMVSSCGRYVLVFNGEIYNYRELRAAVEQTGRQIRGGSDTEVLLEGLAAWGIPTAVQRSNGMFAIAVWDRQSRKLTLARDHVGIKPLFYGWSGRTFLFGSELKALCAHPGFEATVAPESLALLLRLGYIPAPNSIWRNIWKLPPGHLVELTAPDQGAAARPFWTLASGDDERWSGSGDATEILHVLLRDAVRRQMVADVALGAFLSGGIDSSTVVALMQSQSSRPVRTFSIGYDEAAYDEAPHARAVARHLGTDHTELTARPADALATIPRLATVYDEPFADSSQVPTMLLSHLTREHVKVALSGDGGDELFAGYEHYLHDERRWRSVQRVPRWLRRGCVAPLAGLGSYKWRRLAGALRADDVASFYRGQVAKWLQPRDLMAGFVGDPWPSFGGDGTGDTVTRMAYFDFHNYLPEDVLTKVDRASMAVALETRVPLLDKQVVTFAFSLPVAMKWRGGLSKWLLRQVLYQYVPAQILERPKMGFRAPVAQWLRGPLRDWAEDLLSETRLRHSGLLLPAPIRRVWEQHRRGIRNWEHLLWIVLMYQAWDAEWNRARRTVEHGTR